MGFLLGTWVFKSEMSQLRFLSGRVVKNYLNTSVNVIWILNELFDGLCRR